MAGGSGGHLRGLIPRLKARTWHCLAQGQAGQASEERSLILSVCRIAWFWDANSGWTSRWKPKGKDLAFHGNSRPG